MAHLHYRTDAGPWVMIVPAREGPRAGWVEWRANGRIELAADLGAQGLILESVWPDRYRYCPDGTCRGWPGPLVRDPDAPTAGERNLAGTLVRHGAVIESITKGWGMGTGRKRRRRGRRA